jgi:cytochrome c556
MELRTDAAEAVRYISRSTRERKSMRARILITIVVIGGLITGTGFTYAAEPSAADKDIKLSPELLNLLRDEMREIAGGVQAMALSIATADWKSIQETSAKIRASYIMEKKLTSAQARALEAGLPERFKELDAAFHQRAEKLGAAAAAQDAELVAFQYSRLLESCTVCHSEYAKSRFPGFAPATKQVHHH